MKIVVSTCFCLAFFLFLTLLPPSFPPFPKNVPVQENGLLPLQANPERVHQLSHLGQRKQRHPQTRSTITIDPIRGGTDSLLEGMRRDKPQQVRHKANRAQGAIHREEQIPISQGLAQILDRAVLHDARQEDNHGDINGQGRVGDPPVARDELKDGDGVVVLFEGQVELLQEGEELPELWRGGRSGVGWGW